jgi:hypothetical protein
MFVVYIEPSKGEPPFANPFKAFGTRLAADTHASEQVSQEAEKAFVLDVPGVDDARKAIAAIQMGEGTIVKAVGKKLSEQEMQDDWRRALAGSQSALSRVFQD